MSSALRSAVPSRPSRTACMRSASFENVRSPLILVMPFHGRAICSPLPLKRLLSMVSVGKNRPTSGSGRAEGVTLVRESLSSMVHRGPEIPTQNRMFPFHCRAICDACASLWVRTSRQGRTASRKTLDNTRSSAMARPPSCFTVQG